VRRAAVLGLIIVAALLVIVPWQGELDRLGDAAALPPVPAAIPTIDIALSLLSRGLSWRVEPDYSLFLVHNVQFAERRPWHLATTYGPWGFLFRGYAPRNYAPLVALWSALAALAVLLLRDRPVAAAAMLVVLAADPRAGMLLVFPLLLLRAWFAARAHSATTIGAIAATGLLGLVKASSLVLGGVVVAAIGVDEVRRRRVPWTPIVYAASLLAWWLIAGQDLGWIAPFLRATWHVTSGYGEAASAGTTPVLTVLMFVAAIAFVAWLRRDAIETAALALLLLGFAKAGLVRADIFHAALAPMALLTLMLAYAPRWTAIAAVAIIAPYLPAPGELGRQIIAMANPAAAKRASDALYARDLASIRARLPRPPVDGTVDVYGNWQSVAIAYGLDYRPRPVFQSYIAYDAALAAMNARHLRDDPPQSLLFAINYTDGRYPALDDALSWPEILAHYAPVAASRDFVAMRRMKPRTLRVVAARTLHGRLGEPLAIPPAALLWAEVHVETTMLGKLLAFAYKLPELRIAVNGIEGRFLRRTAGAGFLLSPIVTQPRELFGGQPARSMTIRGGGLYERDVTVVLKELRVE